MLKIVYDEGKSVMRDQKSLAIQFVRRWVNSELHDFVEPVRSGVPKGSLIGFSESKEKAALFMVLYPNTIDLSGIAKLAGVSLGVLHVWQTQENFKLAVREKCERLGQTIMNIVQNYLTSWQKEKVDKTLNLAFGVIDRLPFFNEAVSMPLMELATDKIQSGALEYALVALRRSSYGSVADRRVKLSPEILKLKRVAIEATIDQLANPQIFKKYEKGMIQNVTELLKKESTQTLRRIK